MDEAAVEQLKRPPTDAALVDPARLDPPQPLEPALHSAALLDPAHEPALLDPAHEPALLDPAHEPALLHGATVPSRADELPAELLIAILSALPVADLIRCRKVCRQWRAAVAAMAERDARHAFRCGAKRAGAQWAVLKARERGEIKRIEDVEEDELYDDGYGELSQAHFFSDVDRIGVCSCGAETKEDLRFFFCSYRPTASYAERHAAPHPPLRWEVAAAESALATELTALAWPTLRFANVLRYHSRDGAAETRWVPTWYALTNVHAAALPKTHREMAAFASAMTKNSEYGGERKAAETSFASKDGAAAYYAKNWVGGREDLSWPVFWQLLAGARVVGLVLASGGAIAESYVSQVTRDVVEDALHEFSEPYPTDAGALEKFADTFCNGDSVLAGQWERLVRQATANDPVEPTADQRAAMAAILDEDWKDVLAWTDVPVPIVFAFPGADSSVPQRSLFEALCRHVLGCLPLYELSKRRLMRRHGYHAWQLQQLYARQAAAAWRICCGLGWTPWLREQRHAETQFPALGRKWVEMSDDAVQAFLDSQVAAVDAVQAFLEAKLRVPVFVEVYEYGGCEANEYVYWLGGLSPHGNLVGAAKPKRIEHSSESESEDD